ELVYPSVKHTNYTTSTPSTNRKRNRKSTPPTPLRIEEKRIVVTFAAASRTLTHSISHVFRPTPTSTSLKPPNSPLGSNKSTYWLSSVPFSVALKSFFRLPSPSKKDNGISERKAFLRGLLITWFCSGW